MSDSTHEPTASAAAEDAIRDIVERADEQRAHYEESADRPEKPSLLGRWATLLFLTLVLVGSAAWSAQRMARPPEPIAQEDLDRAARVHLAILAQAAEKYREAHGEPPTSLAQIGFPDEGVEILPSGGSYRLISEEVGRPVVYEGGTDPQALLSSGNP